MYCCHCIGIGTDIVSTVAYATKQLQQCYICSRCSSTVDEWPPYQRKHYTTLAFIHDKSKFIDAVRFSATQELTVAGNINTSQLYRHANLNASMTKNISDIFLPVTASHGSFVDLHILIEGAPGIGKTVLTKEIAYQWAKNKLLTSKRLILLVFLRECHQNSLKSIEDLVKYVFATSKVTTCLTDYLLQTEGKDTVIIFDGFDELPEESRKKSIIVDIIHRRILTKSCLVITSRPTASSSLHGSVDRRVEIVGFTKEDRLDYIQTSLGDHDEQVKALQHYLQSNPTINALCYIPLNMTILLCLVEDGIDRLPKTQTEMYKRFIETTIIRYIKKFENRDIIINIAELPYPYDKLLVELAKLAYKALETDKIVFTLSEVNKDCPNLTMTSSNWNGLGLLKAVQCYNKEIGNDQVTFHFLHFSMQEYMAAWYISTLSDRKQIKLLQKTFWKHRYYNTWIMYVGITGGCTFALRHFLSGNWFQLYSKFFGASKVSIKFLNNKMKCLHLFQCLIEADKVDSMKQLDSVKELFQNNQIDLSNQTLLPSDLNTLGFFLIRSINKEWDKLNLSNCSIGSNGSNILCDRLLDKDVRCIVTIKTVNFSYNQLDFSSLIRLFGLFNSWHTSEIIITDNASLGKITSQKIEDIVLQSSTLVLVHVTSWLFCKNAELSKIHHILSSTTNIKSVYLLNCTWTYDSELLTLLRKQKLHKVHIVSSFLDIAFFKTVASILLNNNDSVNMFVYDPTMSDQIADNISSLIISSNKDISGVMLIVSSSKVQGIVNTYSLSNELSALETFNLSRYVTYLNSKVCPWSLEGNSYDNHVIFIFIKLLHKIDFDWKLKVLLWEHNTVIVHKTTFNSFALFKQYNNIYLSNCDISELEYDVISRTCSTLHILNSPQCVEILHAKLSHQQFVPNELFIYGNIEYNLMNSLTKTLSHNRLNISAVLSANNIMIGYNPNSELIALAFQLQQLPTTWILSITDNKSVFYQVIDAISFIPEWVELDFTGCDIGDVECEVVQRTFRCNHHSTVRKLNISFNKLSVSGIQDLAKTVLMWGVQEVNINGTNDTLLDCLIKNLMNKHQKNIFLSITYNHRRILVVCNTSWDKIITKMDTQAYELHIINCELQLNSTEICNYLHKARHLLKLYIINCSIAEAVITYIIQTFFNKIIEVSISDVRIIGDDRIIRNLLTRRELYLNMKLNFVLSTEYWLCVHNMIKHQLRLIHKYFMNQVQLNSCAMTMVKKLEQTDGERMYIFENDHLIMVCIHARTFQATGVTEIITALSNSTSLSIIDIENYYITNKNADNLVTILYHNPQLQELHLNINNLQTNSITEVIKALHSVATLKKFSFCYNGITDKAANDIAAVISCNTGLQVLNINGNDLKTSGAILISRALQKVSTLKKLYINNNKVTCEAGDEIAAAISCNRKLQEFDVSENNLQTKGTIKVIKALQGIHMLNQLYLGGNNITGKAANDIAAAISCNTKLRVLNINGNDLKTSGAIIISRALQKVSKLTKLYINNNKVTCEAADEIAAAISCNRKLQDINVSENNLQTKGIIKIMKALQGIHTLNRLYLGGNNITGKAANDIAAAISCNTKLRVLNINGNDLKTSGAIIISRALQKVSTLTKLYINCNKIACEAAGEIAAAISCNRKLQDVDVSGNNLQTVGTIKIMRALRRIHRLNLLYLGGNNITSVAANDIAAAISCNSGLQELNINRNNLETSGAIIVAKSLQKVSGLTKLHISENNITYQAADEIAAAICCNVKLEEFDLSGNFLRAKGVIKIAIALQNVVTLKKLNMSNTNITHEAASSIADVITHNTHLQEFIISGNRLEVRGAIIIAKSLQRISTLTRLYIANNNISDGAADDIAAAVSCNFYLQEFDIGRNHLQESGIASIAKGLQNISTLTKLCINNNDFTLKAVDYTAGVISCKTQLKEFDVSGNRLGIVTIAKALQSVVTLTKLNISNCNITCTAVNAIAVAITCNTHLQEFVISGNRLEVRDTTKISKSLQRISRLTKLYIANTNISDGAADDIAAAVSCNIYLQEFDIGGNNLQASGTTKIAKGLQKISTLTKLYINYNKISYEAADDIAAAISSNAIQILDVGGNYLETTGITTIAKSLQSICTLTYLNIRRNKITDEATDAIAAAISCNPYLEEFDIAYNEVQGRGAIKLAKSFQQISTLKKLFMNNNKITDEASRDIAAAIKCNPHLNIFWVDDNAFTQLDYFSDACAANRNLDTDIFRISYV